MHLVETIKQGTAQPARLALVGARVRSPESGRGAFLSRHKAAASLAARMRGLWSKVASAVVVEPRRNQMRVLETLHLGAKRQIVLVSCRGERFLVGTGADSVDTIVRLRAKPGAMDDVAGVHGHNGART